MAIYPIKKVDAISCNNQIVDIPKTPKTYDTDSTRCSTSSFYVTQGLISSFKVSMETFRHVEEDSIEKSLTLTFVSESWWPENLRNGQENIFISVFKLISFCNNCFAFHHSLNGSVIFRGAFKGKIGYFDRCIKILIVRKLQRMLIVSI